MAGLRCAQDRSAAPDLQIAHGDLKARAQVPVLHQHLQTFLRVFGQQAFMGNEQVGVGLFVRSSDPAS